MDALVGKLKKDYGLGNAEEVLLSGCSAGGMATYLHADYMKTQVANNALTKYKVASLSGFFLDHKTAAGVVSDHTNYVNMFGFQNMAAGVNQYCIRAHPANQSFCSTPQANYAYIQAPFFVLNSMLDNYQMKDIFDVGCDRLAACNATQIGWMNQYQSDFHSVITNTATFKKDGNGAFLYNCDQHCAEQDSTGFNQITVAAGDGIDSVIVSSGGGGSRSRSSRGGGAVDLTLMQEALDAWWKVPVGAPEPAAYHTYVEQCLLRGAAPCNPTCGAS